MSYPRRDNVRGDYVRGDNARTPVCVLVSTALEYQERRVTKIECLSEQYAEC